MRRLLHIVDPLYYWPLGDWVLLSWLERCPDYRGTVQQEIFVHILFLYNFVQITFVLDLILLKPKQHWPLFVPENVLK